MEPLKKPFTIYPEDWEIMETLTSEDMGILITALITGNIEDTNCAKSNYAVRIAYAAIQIIRRLMPDEE
jgi:hypothetical protein